MKIFDILTQFTKAIRDRLFRLLSSKSTNPLSTTSLSERTRIKQKTVRKRKSFHSFVREHNSQRLSNSSRRNRPKDKRHLQLKSERQFQKSVSHDSDCSSNEAHLQEKITNEVLLPAPLEPPPIFVGKDGLEISIIEPDNRFEPLNNSVESDSEILKFLYGGDQKPSQPANINEKSERQPQIEWWKQALEDSIKSQQSELNERIASQRALNEQSGGSRKRKTKKIKHVPRSKLMKHARGLRVITLLDLVENEDCPRLFHIPLKQE